MIERNGKVYRNLEEQVLKNKQDIEELAESLGTQVIANPEEEATADLEKIKIANVTYDIPGASGSATWGNIQGDIDDQTDLKNALDAKQNELTAGANITISDGVISATDTTYSSLPAEASGTAVSLVTTGEKAVWNGKQDELVAGANITISGNVISASGQLSSAAWGQITGTLADQTDLKNALDAKQDLIDSSHKLPASNVSGLATVATSGDYDDLTNKPTIPAAQIQSDWTQSDNTKLDYIKNKPSLATVATSGDYNDLSNKPVIPVDTNTWRAIKVNGVQKLDNQITGNALDLVAGSNITLTESNGAVTIASSGTSYNTATSNTAGIVKLGSDTVQSEAPQTASSTQNRTYPVQLNLGEQMVVNVPWVNTTYSSLPAASGGTDVSLVTTGEKYTWGEKQDALVSGINIKTINNQSLLGSGNIDIQGGGGGSYTAGDGIDITNDVISMAYPSIIILGAND